jgi:hypothetical protein
MYTDKNMLDASFRSAKRAASPQTDRTTKQQDAHFAELKVDETKVSTKSNWNTVSPFLETLAETILNLAKTPYTKLFGDDQGGTTAFHDDLQLIIGYAGWWIYDTANISQWQLKEVKEASESSPIITTAKWTTLNRILFGDETQELITLTQEQKHSFCIISSRLSHTKPSIIAGKNRVLHSKIPGIHASLAWRGVVNVLGSAYLDGKTQGKKAEKC